MNRGTYITVIVFLVFAIGIYGQSTRVRELSEAISSGDVTLSANGNGSSSGAAIIGTLTNSTSAEIRVNVTITGGIYLRNSGSGQNMVGTQIFLFSGGYTESGTSRFIKLPSSSITGILIIAFCSDFELDNPSRGDNFSIAPMPTRLQSISEKISRYLHDNFDDDPVIPVQLALWNFQGESRSHIREKFNFDDSDWMLAADIIDY